MVFEEAPIQCDLPKSDRTLLIDADSLLFRAAYKQTEVEEAFYSFCNSVLHMKKRCGVEKCEVVFSCPRADSFRRALYPGYKRNRVTVEAPKLLPMLREKICESFSNVVELKNIEADDYVVAHAKFLSPFYIAAAYDKDVAGSLSFCYDWMKDKFLKRDEVVADSFKYIQCLSGDSSDGIPGIPKVGLVKATAFVQKALTLKQDLWKTIVVLYKEAGLDEQHALLNMRLVSMEQVNPKTLEINLFNPKLEGKNS